MQADRFARMKSVIGAFSRTFEVSEQAVVENTRPCVLKEKP